MTATSLNNLAGKSVVVSASLGIAGGILAHAVTPFAPLAGFIGGAVIGGTYLPFHYTLENFELENNTVVKTIGFIALQIFNILISNQLCRTFNVSMAFGASSILNVGILAVSAVVYIIYQYTLN